MEGVLREIDRVVSSEAVGAKEVSDAAVALAYLQAKGNRRCNAGDGSLTRMFAAAVPPCISAGSMRSWGAYVSAQS